jgi:hypothetical protein
MSSLLSNLIQQLMRVNLVNLPTIVVGTDISELQFSSSADFEATNGLAVSLAEGPVLVRVEGVTVDGVYGVLGRTLCRTSTIVSTLETTSCQHS